VPCNLYCELNKLIVLIHYQDTELCSLRSRGLCIVPVSFTNGVAEGNGADIWAPIKTTSPKHENDVSQFQ
jgi:hypothetical protein